MRGSKILTTLLIFSLIVLFSNNSHSLSFDGFISTGLLEYRGTTERNGYILGINTDLFLFSDLAANFRGNIIDLTAYKNGRYVNTSKIINFSTGLLYIVDVMTLIPFIRVDAELFSGNFIGEDDIDYGYSLGSGVRYEKGFLILILELAYKQLYRTTTEWPSIILFSVGIGLSSNREKNREVNL